MRSTPRFRRIILSLRPGAIDRGALEVSAEMAGLLGAALQGVFIEEESLRRLATASRMREFHLLAREWRTVNADRLAEELQLAAQSARRLVEQIALERGIESFFEVLGGEAVGTFLSHPRDIVVVASPDSPQERLALLSSRLEPLRGAASATMLLPKRAVRRKGPVVGMAAAAGDATLRVAAAIAHAARERLLLLVPEERPDYEVLADAVSAVGVQPRDVELRRLAKIDTQSFLAALDPLHERVIVLPKADVGAAERVDCAMVVSRRSAPVLLLDPLATFESS